MDGIGFVKYIELKLISLGISKEAFYAESGISTANMSQWRTGKYNPSPKAQQKAEDFFEKYQGKEKPTATGELDKDTMELLDLAHCLGEDDRALLLSMARELKKRNSK